MAMLSVAIPTASTWPTIDDLSARNAITDDLSAANVGAFIGAGGGGGEMDFQFEVADEQAARDVIGAAIRRHLPGAKYQVRNLG